MVLTNFYNILNAAFSVSVNQTQRDLPNAQIQLTNGNVILNMKGGDYSFNSTIPFSVLGFANFDDFNNQYGAPFIAMGTGEIPPKLNDYTLNDIVYLNNLKNSTNFSNGKYSFSGSFVNDSETAVTFQEIGYGVKFLYNGNFVYCLLTRDILTEPITVEPNKSIAVTLQLTSQ